MRDHPIVRDAAGWTQARGPAPLISATLMSMLLAGLSDPRWREAYAWATREETDQRAVDIVRAELDRLNERLDKIVDERVEQALRDRGIG